MNNVGRYGVGKFTVYNLQFTMYNVQHSAFCLPLSSIQHPVSSIQYTYAKASVYEASSICPKPYRVSTTSLSSISFRRLISAYLMRPSAVLILTSV